MSRTAVDVEMATSDEDASSSEIEHQMIQRDRAAGVGAFMLGFGVVMAIAGAIVVSTRAVQNPSGDAERSLETPDTELVPAISSSVGLPNLDPPPGMSMDAEWGAAVGVSSLPVVEKVNVGSLPYGHPSPSFDYPKYPGFTLWLVEEFDAPVDLDTDAIWTYSDGGLTEGQVRFVKDAITFQDGKMHIEMSNRGLPQGSQCSHAEVGYVGHKALTSGEFRTRYNMYRYGRYEMRMKAPSVQHNNPGVNGNFISTMFVYRDAKFRHWREIDFEITADQKNAVAANVLKADHTSTWNGGIQSSLHMQPKGLDVRSEFHTYAFQWLPDKITWWIDDKVVREYKGGRVAIPDMSTKIMMNLWTFTGGGFGGSQAHNNRYPMHSEYDWFRFYKWDGDKQYPCLAMDQTCLTDDDQYLAGNNPCDGIDQHGTLNGRNACMGTCKRSTSIAA
jgi:beta-glucanase (GH16 family)